MLQNPLRDPQIPSEHFPRSQHSPQSAPYSCIPGFINSPLLYKRKLYYQATLQKWYEMLVQIHQIIDYNN